MDKNMMLVLVGQRRVGKNIILLDLKRWIENNAKNANVFYIDKENKAGDGVMDAETLYKISAERLPLGERNYLLIDEVQNIANFNGSDRWRGGRLSRHQSCATERFRENEALS